MPKDPKETPRLMKIAMQVRAELGKPKTDTDLERIDAPATWPADSLFVGPYVADGRRLIPLAASCIGTTGGGTWLDRWAGSAGSVLELVGGDPAALRAELLRHAAFTLRLLERLDAEGT